MITIIVATNRPGNQTRYVAESCHTYLEEMGSGANILYLENFKSFEKNEWFKTAEESFVHPADKFIIVAPEYNGSFPGVLKMFIDMTSPKDAWHNKKAMLIGVAEGRAGNLRGLDHLTGILHHLKVHVMHNKIPISKISSELNADGTLKNEETITLIKNQLQDFLNF
jgi:chromate reductase, NAD(P)H dehydrogenase (quinone)